MSEISDPYLYPGTDVLRNIPGILNAEALTAFETLNSGARMYELTLQPMAGNFDTGHLKAIHKYIFRDVYVWAGRFRTTVLGKAQFAGGPVTYFTPPHLLEHEAQRIFERLHRAKLLKGLSGPEFAKKAASLLAELNTLHPYREGNGRTQRTFVQTLAREAGHALHFDVVTQERMIRASILATAGDSSMMVRLFDEITDAERIPPLRRAIEFLAANRFPWNTAYLATATPEQTYAGRLVGRDGTAFMMRTDSDQIIIGQQADIPAYLRSGDHFSFTARRVTTQESGRGNERSNR
jgi:cell filamentation protein